MWGGQASGSGSDVIFGGQRTESWDEDTGLSDTSRQLSLCTQIQDFGPGLKASKAVHFSGLPAEIITQGSHDGDVIGVLEPCCPQQ